MKKIIFFFTLTLLFASGLASAHTAPKSLAGFVLGEHISKFRDNIAEDSKMCVRYRTYLHEVEVTNLPGFRTGLICVGNCAELGKIVRIKLKYADPSKKFYDQLLKRFKNKYGKPDEWKGDAFGVMIAWKWSFTDENNNKISLTLQHNSADTELKMGNAVKLSMTSALEAEKACYQLQEKEAKDAADAASAKTPATHPKSVPWDILIPQ